MDTWKFILAEPTFLLKCGSASQRQKNVTCCQGPIINKYEKNLQRHRVMASVFSSLKQRGITESDCCSFSFFAFLKKMWYWNFLIFYHQFCQWICKEAIFLALTWRKNIIKVYNLQMSSYLLNGMDFFYILPKLRNKV